VYHAVLIVALVLLLALVVLLVETGKWGPAAGDSEPFTPRWVRDVHDWFVGTSDVRVRRIDS
jgi:hypothetical protein